MILEKLFEQETTFIENGFLQEIGKILSRSEELDESELRDITTQIDLKSEVPILRQWKRSIEEKIELRKVEEDQAQTEFNKKLQPFRNTIERWVEQMAGPAPQTLTESLAHRQKKGGYGQL